MKPSEIFEGENSSLKKAFDMTNNNWIEEFDKEFRIMHLVEIDEVDGTFSLESDRNQVKEFISNLLTQKNQEHKAELEMIKGEIEDKQTNYEPDLSYRDPDFKLAQQIYTDSLKDTLSILDSHINNHINPQGK